jgi:hypothetical protein
MVEDSAKENQQKIGENVGSVPVFLVEIKIVCCDLNKSIKKSSYLPSIPSSPSSPYP